MILSVAVRRIFKMACRHKISSRRLLPGFLSGKMIRDGRMLIMPNLKRKWH